MRDPGIKIPQPRKRVRTPTVLQMEGAECGAASLAMILGYHKRFVPLERLRTECGVSRDGSKASNLVKVARAYGFEAKGLRRELEELHGLELPFIAFWGFSHFLVVEGFGRRGVYVNDPALGPRIIDYEEFDDNFTGVALTFSPTPDFRPGGEKKSLLQSLGGRLHGSETGLLFVLLASLGLVVPGFLVPAFLRVFIDRLMQEPYRGWILGLLAAMLVAAAVKGALTWLQQHHLARVETRMALGTSARYFWHLLSLPMGFFTQRSAGDVGGRVALNDRVASLLSGQLASAAFNTLMVAFYAVVMFSYDAVLTGVVVAIGGLNVLALTSSSRALREASLRLQTVRARLLGATYGGVSTIETLKATGREADFFTRWAGYQARLVNLEQEQDRTSRLVLLAPQLVTSLGTSLVLALGALRVMDGAMTIGMLVAFQVLMATFMDPLNQLVLYGAQIEQARADMDRLDDVMAYPPEVAVDPHAEPAGERLSGRVEMRDVTFGYSPMAPPLLENFNLVLEPGQRVAVVGATGSGKTSVARVLSGLYQPWSGEIRFDGRPRAAIPRSVMTASLALVDQDIRLFAGTVRENLTLWDESITEEDLVRALQDAAVDDRVLERPGGLDAPVAEGGANFSGGERQRLEIARALVTRPSVLVMDEATSALDPLLERLVDERLRSRGCSCLIVAHRLSTIRDCDEILVMERGRIVQRGQHDDLAAVEGAYQRLLGAELVRDAV